jgi:hypothetical protein
MRIPFDYGAIGADADWRSRLHWPISHRHGFDLATAICATMLEQLAAEDDACRRDAFTLAIGHLSTTAVYLGQVAATLDRAALDQGAHPPITFAGTTKAFAQLHDGQTFEDDGRIAFDASKLAVPGFQMLRRIARIHTWTPSRQPLRLLRSVLRPQALGLSHNGLMIAYAASRGEAIGFEHAATLYARIAATRKPQDIDLIGDTVERLIGRVIAICALRNASYEARLRQLLRERFNAQLQLAHADLEAASRLPTPRRLLAGTGGYWPTRVLSIAALRKGVQVDRFEHGIQAGLLCVTEPIRIAELCVSSRFFLPSNALRERLHAAITGAPPSTIPVLEHHPAGLDLVPAFAPRTRRPGAGPRVLYGPSILLGERQFTPPMLTDVVHWDHQLRMVEMLSSMPIELLLRPHPEGLFSGRRHPLNDLHRTDPRRYETIVDEADVMVFDYGQSTTLFEALSSDRHVVFIDLGNPLYTASIRTMLAQRCRVIEARFDDRNRPQIDADELKDAICDNTFVVDPTPFRRLLLD